jgi:hypothetical protein
VIVDRIINGVGAALASAVLVPVVSTIQRVIESSRAKGLPSTNSRAAAVDSAVDERGRVSVIPHSRPGTADRPRL